jgi:hypothetical protein
VKASELDFTSIENNIINLVKKQNILRWIYE